MAAAPVSSSQLQPDTYGDRSGQLGQSQWMRRKLFGFRRGHPAMCMLEPPLTVTTHLKSWSRKVPADITGWLSPACGGGWTWMSSNLCFSALSENQPTPATQPALSDIIHRRGEERRGEGYKYWFEPHGITQLFSGDPNIPGSPSQQSGARLHTIIQNIIQIHYV